MRLEIDMNRFSLRPCGGDRFCARTYGALRVWHDILAEGASCGLHKIERLMRESALRARPRRRGLPKDNGQRLANVIAPNVLDRQFSAERPNQKWIADFTYIWTAEGWDSLARFRAARCGFLGRR
jgi:transposase InsO family protein